MFRDGRFELGTLNSRPRTVYVLRSHSSDSLVTPKSGRLCRRWEWVTRCTLPPSPEIDCEVLLLSKILLTGFKINNQGMYDKNKLSCCLGVHRLPTRVNPGVSVPFSETMIHLSCHVPNSRDWHLNKSGPKLLCVKHLNPFKNWRDSE